MNSIYIIDNIPLLFISLAIVIVQCFIFLSTSKKIQLLKGVLADNEHFRLRKKYFQVEEDPTTVVVLTHNNDNIVTQEIETSINTYLERNKGAVSDFNLIKDIVERNCDTLVSEVESQTSMPLYIGLIGTVAGIVLGLASLALRGEDLGDPSCIMALMVGVAFAMIASGMGVLFTSMSIWKNKKCMATLENNKNKFYTWIQTELLPVLTTSTVSTLSLLERNLTNFNNSFAKVVKQLDEKLSDVGDLYSSQIELLDRIEKIDIHKMATANLKILEALTRSADKLENFALYMEETTAYLTAVKELNGKIDDHLERTEALAVISDFYKNQMDEIQLRQNAIKTVATNVDDTVKKAFADLTKNTQTGLQGLQTIYTKQTEIMTNLANEEANALQSTIKKLDAVIILSKELQQLPKVVAELSKNAVTQSKATTDLAKAVAKLEAKKNGGGGGSSWFRTQWQKFIMLFSRKKSDNQTSSKISSYDKNLMKKGGNNSNGKQYIPRNINKVQ